MSAPIYMYSNRGDRLKEAKFAVRIGSEFLRI